MRTALVLAGHGSHISPQTAGLVWRQVDALRSRCIADEITACFWKEAPSFSTVLGSLSADDITIVPLFTAAGYFTRTVIPAEMGLSGAITQRDERTIRYARALGEHHYVSDVVRRRVEEALLVTGLDPDQVGVAVIGHGTKRAPESRETTREQAAALTAAGVVRQAVAVFLDDTPSIPDLYDLLDTPCIIAVPNFLALGSHTTIDVPKEIGFQSDMTHGVLRGRMVYYTDPVGLDESLTDAILDLAGDAGLPPREGTGGDCFPTVGRDALIELVRERGEVRFGQLVLTESQVRTEGNCTALLTPAELDALREYVRTRPHYRPLMTATDMPGGWCLDISAPEQIYTVVETVYPGVVADWAILNQNQFQHRELAEVIARQTGQYRDLADLPPEQGAELVARVCGGCIRQPTWSGSAMPAGGIPCMEPCNYWMSKAVGKESS